MSDAKVMGMTPDVPSSATPPPDDESLAAIRGYLLHLAEQHLDGDLHAKAGASDLVQVAMLAAHENRDQYQGQSEAQLKGWLRRILLNVIRKFRRHWRRQERAANREVPIADNPALQLPPDNHDTPSSFARRQEQHGQLADAVALLTEEQRRAVGWRIDDGLSFADIGARLGKNTDAARMLFHRALERLQELLPPESAHGEDSP